MGRGLWKTRCWRGHRIRSVPAMPMFLTYVRRVRVRAAAALRRPAFEQAKLGMAPTH